MRVVDFECILHQHLPEARKRHLRPYLRRRFALLIVQSFQDQVLLVLRQVHKVTAESMLRLCVDGLLSQRKCFTVLRHGGIAIADGSVLVKAFVNRLNQRDAPVGCAVRLRNKMIENSAPEGYLLWSEVANLRGLLHPHQDQVAGRFIPELLL